MTSPAAPLDGDREVAVGGAVLPCPRDGVTAVVVWCSVVVPTSGGLLDKASSGARGAVLIAVITAALIAGLRLWPLDRRAGLAVVAFTCALGVVLTVPVVGRAPFALALLATATGEEAWHGLPGRASRRRGEVRITAVAIQVVAAIVWIATERLAPSVALLVAAAVATQLGRTSPIASLEATAQAFLGRRGGRAAAALGRARAGARNRTATFLAALARRAASASRTAWSWLMARENRPVLITGLIAGLLVAPIYPRLTELPPILVRGTNDIPGTILRAEWIRWWPLRMSVPHPGWSLLLLVFVPLLGEAWAVTFILAVATGVGAALLVVIGRSRWDGLPALRWPFASALGLGWVLLENPAVLVPTSDQWWGRFPFAGDLARGTSYAPLHQWSTPTVTLSMPFVFALFTITLLALQRSTDPEADLRSVRRTLLVLTVVGTLVQPATTLILVPAAPLYLLITRTLDRRSARTIGWSLVLPGAAIVIGQVVFLASNVSPWEQATWLWKPFWVVPYFGADRIAFWAGALFVPLGLWVCGRRYREDPGIRLAALGLVVGAVPFLLLEQTTVANVPDGDLGVPPLMALILLFLRTLRLILIDVQALWDRRAEAGFRVPAWALAAAVYFLVMLCAGVLDLTMASGVVLEN